jgi:hypothetical protein
VQTAESLVFSLIGSEFAAQNATITKMVRIGKSVLLHMKQNVFCHTRENGIEATRGGEHLDSRVRGNDVERMA